MLIPLKKLENSTTNRSFFGCISFFFQYNKVLFTMQHTLSSFLTLFLVGALSLPLFGDVRVTEVPRPSRASRSGLIPGDVVRQINGAPVANQAALQQALETAPDGAEMLVFRVDRELKLRLATVPKERKAHTLRTDWDEKEQKEELRTASLREILRLLQAPVPDAAAIRRCMEKGDSKTVTFFHEKMSVGIILREGRVFLLITDDELTSLYELGAGGEENRLPAELTEELQHLSLD